MICFLLRRRQINFEICNVFVTFSEYMNFIKIQEQGEQNYILLKQMLCGFIHTRRRLFLHIQLYSISAIFYQFMTPSCYQRSLWTNLVLRNAPRTKKLIIKNCELLQESQLHRYLQITSSTTYFTAYSLVQLQQGRFLALLARNVT